MREKYDDRYEDQILKFTENNLLNKKYKIFDGKARVVTRRRITGLVEEGNSKESTCLVLTNQKGETVVLTPEFEMILYNVLK